MPSNVIQEEEEEESQKKTTTSVTSKQHHTWFFILCVFFCFGLPTSLFAISFSIIETISNKIKIIRINFKIRFAYIINITKNHFIFNHGNCKRVRTCVCALSSMSLADLMVSSCVFLFTTILTNAIKWQRWSMQKNNNKIVCES